MKLEDLTEEQFKILNENNLLKLFFPNSPLSYNEIQKVKRPTLLKDIDLSRVISTIETCFDYLEKEKYFSEDNSQYIMESTLEALYGKDVFKFINHNSK